MVIKNNIKINNFGPIKKADIDIAPLTIFVGPNGSGKSYAALLIHSFLNPFERNFFDMQVNFIKSLDILLNNNEAIFSEFNDEFIEYLSSTSNFNENPFKFPLNKFKQLICDGIGRFYLQFIEKKFKDNFSSNYNKFNNFIIGEDFSLEFNNISFTNHNNNLKLNEFFLDLVDVNSNIGSKKRDLISNVSCDDDYISITLNNLILTLYAVENNVISSMVYGIFSEAFIGMLISDSYYIPASRYEISHNLNSNLSVELGGSFNSSKIDKELMLLLLNNKNIENGVFRDIAIEMSENIFGGTLIFNNIDKGIKFIDNSNGFKFDFDNVSSSIKELTPLIKYLMDLSRIGDTLIIEEPENHLHPENQMILVKYLVKLINNGLNIVLTTHSNHILEQFNNLILLNDLDDVKLKELNYSTDLVLNHDDVKIYNFKKDSNYLYDVCEVEITESGFVGENLAEL